MIDERKRPEPYNYRRRKQNFKSSTNTTVYYNEEQPQKMRDKLAEVAAGTQRGHKHLQRGGQVYAYTNKMSSTSTSRGFTRGQWFKIN